MSKNSVRGRVVRSVWDRKGYADPEPFSVDELTGEVIPGWGPEKVDSSGYEPIEKMIQRFFRGEFTPSTAVEYEFGPDIDPVLALEMMNPIMRRGVDRVDAVNFVRQAQGIFRELNRAKQGLKEPKGAKAPEAPPPAESGSKQ